MKVGDVIAVDAPVAEVETAKAGVEVPSPHAGVVAVLHGAEGDVVNVGEPLLTVRSDDGGEAARVSPEAEAYEERAARATCSSATALLGTGLPAAAVGANPHRPLPRRDRIARPCSLRSSGGWHASAT